MSADALRRLDRAHARDRWATGAIRSGTLARHYGVQPATARSLRTRVPRGPLTCVLAMLADPEVADQDAGRVLAVIAAAFEERHLYAPTEVLRARRDRIRTDVEHRLEAAQNRAMVVNCPQRVEAYLAHAGALIELAVIEGLLGETAH